MGHQHSYYHTAQGSQWNQQWYTAQLWLKAIMGDVDAQNELGMLYYLQGHRTIEHYKNALFWFEKAAQNGHAQAHFNLGLMYANGQGVVRDNRTAVTWFRKAADIRKKAQQTV